MVDATSPRRRASRSTHRLTVTAHVTIQGALAPKIDLSAFGTAAVSTERTETDPNRLPPGFQLERPKGRVECFLYYLNNQPKYLVFEEEGRETAVLESEWGAPVPRAGFFAAGEIGPVVATPSPS